MFWGRKCLGAGLVSVLDLSKYFASELWGQKFRVGSVSQPALFRGRKCRGASRIIVWKYTFNVARLICTKYLNTKLFNEIFRVSLFHMQNAKIAVYSNFQERFFQHLLLKSMWQFLYFYIANRNIIWEGIIITAIFARCSAILVCGALGK